MKNTVFLILFSSLIGIKAYSNNMRANLQGDEIAEISAFFGMGNTRELSRFLSSSINLSYENNENVHSKAQAEIILNRFFKENPPKSSKITHRLTNNSNYEHAVFLLNTDKGDYRIAVSLKDSEQNRQLIEIRIEGLH